MNIQMQDIPEQQPHAGHDGFGENIDIHAVFSQFPEDPAAWPINPGCLA